MPREDIKEKIYNFLKEKRFSFSQKELHRMAKVSYITVLKWIPVLEKEGKITIREYPHFPSSIKMVKAI